MGDSANVLGLTDTTTDINRAVDWLEVNYSPGGGWNKQMIGQAQVDRDRDRAGIDEDVMILYGIFGSSCIRELSVGWGN